MSHRLVCPAGCISETKKIHPEDPSDEGSCLSARLASAKAAKNWIDAIRRLRQRRNVRYKAAFRKGETLYFKLK